MFLEVSGLTKHFGGVMAVEHISFKVKRGEIFALIGPNGAGKTTVFNLLTGMIPPDEGNAEFKGKSLNGLKPFQIRDLGIARTFQNLQLFNSLSALENVMVGAYLDGNKGFIQSLLRLPGVAGEEEQVRQKSLEVLEELGMGKDLHTPRRPSSLVGNACWRLPGCWQVPRNCFFWTSRPPGLMPARANNWPII